MKRPEQYLEEMNCESFDMQHRRYAYQELEDGAVRIIIENRHGVVVNITEKMTPMDALNYMTLMISGRCVDEDTQVIEEVA